MVEEKVAFVGDPTITDDSFLIYTDNNQAVAGGSHMSMLSLALDKLKLGSYDVHISEANHHKLISYCEANGIDYSMHIKDQPAPWSH